MPVSYCESSPKKAKSQKRMPIVLALFVCLILTLSCSGQTIPRPPSSQKQIAVTWTTNRDAVLSNGVSFEFVPGTLGRHIYTSTLTKVDATRRAGLSPSDAMAAFSSSLAERTNIIRNTNFWLHGVRGITGVSAIRSYGNDPYVVNATAITRRHTIQCWHNRPPIGGKVAFVTTNNVRVVRTVLTNVPVNLCEIPSWMSGVLSSFLGGTISITNREGIEIGKIPDVSVQVLDADLPDDIDPMALLATDAYEISNPANQHYLPTPELRGALPIIVCEQHKMFYLPVAQGEPPSSPWRGWNYSKGFYGGDSGSPAFYLIEDRLVCGVLPWSHPGLECTVRRLNSIFGIPDSPQYLPQRISLSGFPKF
jgi:hypothetical protein